MNDDAMRSWIVTLGIRNGLLMLWNLTYMNTHTYTHLYTHKKTDTHRKKHTQTDTQIQKHTHTHTFSLLNLAPFFGLTRIVA